jgi:hypothetical protein
MDMETLWHGNMAFAKQNGPKDKYSYKKFTTPLKGGGGRERIADGFS